MKLPTVLNHTERDRNSAWVRFLWGSQNLKTVSIHVRWLALRHMDCLTAMMPGLSDKSLLKMWPRCLYNSFWVSQFLSIKAEVSKTTPGWGTARELNELCLGCIKDKRERAGKFGGCSKHEPKSRWWRGYKSNIICIADCTNKDMSPKTINALLFRLYKQIINIDSKQNKRESTTLVNPIRDGKPIYKIGIHSRAH